MKRVALLAAALAASAFAAAGVAASILRTAPLPMDTRVYRDTYDGWLKLRLNGRLPTTAAGQRVDILERDCVYRSDRIVGLTRTRSGGVWEYTAGGKFGMGGGSSLNSGSSYRARWRNRSSAPFTFRAGMHPEIEKVRGRDAYLARIVLTQARQNLRGRFVVLQRLAEGRWVDVRRQRLRHVQGMEFVTTFVVRTNGLTLRVLAPTRTARPCYNAGASEIFKS